ncbi:hypothetical protein [Streptomyces antimycoticus]|uniref:hypothetical protein n=1 Tax=Streptomyces antimycoticus TaxID=68175 RepID=UPI0036ED0B12
MAVDLAGGRADAEPQHAQPGARGAVQQQIQHLPLALRRQALRAVRHSGALERLVPVTSAARVEAAVGWVKGPGSAHEVMCPGWWVPEEIRRSPEQ